MNQSLYTLENLGSGETALSKIEQLKSQHTEITVLDSYKENLEELFLLRNPKYKFIKEYGEDLGKFISVYQGKETSLKHCGSWFYFPWKNTVAHVFPEDEYQELRTGRNQYLISKDEQEKFSESVIGILGMSVGSHIAMTIAMTGGSSHIKIADPDTLSGDNLNRIRLGILDVGTKKVFLVARAIYEMNPYANVEVFEDGLTQENADSFLSGLSLLIEEMDTPFWKFRVREKARSLGIPTLMGTDNGDGCIVDIERFDLNSDYPLFHGYTGNMDAESIKNMPPEDLPKVAARIAGANLAVPRMLHSVTEVGKTIYSWPQLGTAANLCGTVISYLARRIVNKDSLIQSGRYQVSMDSIFEKNYHTIFSKLKRKKQFFDFIRKMKSRDGKIN